MSDPIVDQGVRDRITDTELHRTLFVEAGAGSGKTTQLVTRIANLVIKHDVQLSRIAAITFTEAAASELKARIRVKFEKLLQDSPDPQVRERCERALADSDLAAITTLHGFANRILGEYSVEAGLPPRVRILDEVTSQLAHEARWERFVDSLYADPAHQAVLERAAVVGVPLEPRYPGHATFKDVAAELDQNWDRLVELVDDTPPSIRSVDFSELDSAVDAVHDLPAQCTDSTDKLLVKLVDTIIPTLSAIRSITDPNRKLRELPAVGWRVGNLGSQKAWPDVKSARGTVAAACEAAERIVRDAADDVLRHLLVLVAREVVRAATERREDGGLEFHDLLVLAREMLRTSADARSRLHDQYTHLLLDEFQDTDPIQIELATLIAASVMGDGPASWPELAVEQGRLFFVGDPKQSIYRFRRADVGLFLAARERFGADGAVLQLTTNFRTVEPIVAWVNELFAARMDEVPGQQPRYEPLSAHRSADSPVDHRPVLLGGPHDDPAMKADLLREVEAADVADVVDHIRARPEQWLVEDEAADAGASPWRPARLSDVTILVPARTSVPTLRTALEGRGVPYRLATGTLVYDTQEVRDALAALRAIDDPTDRLNLVAALRSPLYACSDVDLFTFHDAGGRWDLRLDPPDAIGDEHPVRLAFAHLRDLWSQRWWVTPSELLDRLLRDRRAALLGFGEPRPKEVWNRLRFLLDQARQFEESGGGDLRAFLDWAALQGAEGARVHEPLLPDTDEDAVNILTIHGSKGLEFPITILSGMTTQRRGRSGVSVLWPESGPPEVKLRKGMATANHEPRAEIEVEMDDHERLRLLYVAATRARDHLVVSCHHKATRDPAATYGGLIWSYFGEREHLWRPAPLPPETDRDGAEPDQPPFGAAASAAPAAAPPDDDRDEWIARRDALLAPYRVQRVTSATAIAREAAAVAAAAGVEAPDATGVTDATTPDEDAGADAAEVIEGEPRQPDVEMSRRRGRTGTAIGSAVHATLQLLDLTDPRDIDAQVRRQCELEAIPEHVPTVAAMVRSALASDAVRSAAGQQHHKELFVAAPVGARVVEGYIDLLVETPDGLVVIDYKTDSVATEAAADEKLASYELQGASYAAVLEAVTGQSVVDCRFVFCRPGGAIERSVVDLPAAVERVRSTLSS